MEKIIAIHRIHQSSLFAVCNLQFQTASPTITLYVSAKYMKYLSFTLDESIFVIGGDEDYLNPVVIHFNQDGSTGFERCQTGKHERRKKAIGDLLDDKFVVCVGYGRRSVKKNDCEVIDETGTKIFNMSAAIGRVSASSIKLNQTTIWITGGKDSNSNKLNLTEFVTVNGSTSGVNLPFRVFGHCMVQYKPDAILLIGGKQNSNLFSDRTWIIDPTNGFNITEGPVLKERRKYHSCGTVKDELGNVHVIVAGGYKMDSVEILNTTLMKEWVTGW